MKRSGYNGLLMAVVLVALVAMVSGCQEAPEYQVMSASGTGFAIEGANTDQFVVDQTSTGDIVEFRNNGTVRWRLAYDGAITQSGDETHTGDVTVDGSVIVDGTADAVQLTAQGYTTQTSNIFVVETSGEADLFWVDNNGDVEMNGTTPQLTIGDAGEEDTAIVFDGAEQDFYAALDDTANDFLIGLGSTVGTTGIIHLDENQDVGLGGASAGAKLDVTGNAMVDGSADEEQLVVQGNGTQTNNTFVVETSAGTDLFWVDNNGDVEMNGATPQLTIGDAGEEDTAIVFDGAEQDFYVALDDTANDFLIGLGSAVGTTPGLGIDENLAIATYGDITMNGATPQLTIGDAGEEDTAVVFDGAEQDFYAALDDTANDFLIGLGSTVGTTGIIYLDENQDVGLGGASAGAKLDITGNTMIDGAADEEQLVVQGHSTQTSNPFVVETSDGTDKLTVSNEGQVAISAGADSDSANYDYMMTIDYAMTGITTKDRNYGLYITGQRAAGQEVSVGDHDEAGLKIRVDTHAVTTTLGTVLRGADVEAKADNPDGTVYNLYGGLFSAKSDTGAGSVSEMIALSSNVQNNALVTSTLLAADFRLFRQAATEPDTLEAVAQFRNASTSGTGADAALYVKSDGSGQTDDFNYGLDMNAADIDNADIRGSNGETLSNVTDTAWQVGGFLGLEEGTVIDLGADGTITPAASYQPITNSTGGSINTSATTAIADGPVAGAILIICNEDAQDVVIKDAANTAIGGDVTLTGGAQDCLTVIWNGADWVGLAMHDN